MVSCLQVFPLALWSLARRREFCFLDGSTTRKRMTIVFNYGRVKDPSRVHFGEWQEWPDGMLGRIAYAPHVWLKPGDPAPTCPDCGTPFKKTKEYPSIVGFQAECLAKHDPDLNGQSKTTGLFR